VKASRGRREAGQGREEHKEEMNHEGRKESEGRRKKEEEKFIYPSIILNTA
jgi:hypothetical protein